MRAMQSETRTRHDPAVNTLPKVSVVMPAYNAAPFIGETLESVFAQTFNDYEVIVVNDGSPDTEVLERALASYQDRIHYIKQGNLGAGAARNAALRAASGEFIAFLDADDLWLPNYLDEQFRFIQRNNCDLVYSDALLFGDSPIAGRTYMQTSPSNGPVTFKSLVRYECNPITSGVLARRQSILEVGLFDEHIVNGQDFDLWLRLVRNGANVSYQRKVLLRYRYHAESLSSTDPVNKIVRQLCFFDKMIQTYDLTPGERAEVDLMFEKLNAEMQFEIGKDHFARGNFSEARSHLKKANDFQRSWKVRAIILLIRVAPRPLQKIHFRFRGISKV
jgi:teichuronic acid biosynthesis glycosyltransferase TuaG